jgi:hypothetical protein
MALLRVTTKKGERKMKSARLFAMLLGTLLMAGAVSAQKVSSDYDSSTDFAKYKTYAWVLGSNVAKDPLWHQRVVGNIERQLEAKGLKRVDSNPDVYVTYNSELNEDVSIQGFGTGRPWFGGSFSANKVKTIEGTLAVDIHDAQGKRLVWRGIAIETASNKRDKNITKLEKAVAKLFKQYPPKANKAGGKQ